MIHPHRKKKPRPWTGSFAANRSIRSSTQARRGVRCDETGIYWLADFFALIPGKAKWTQLAFVVGVLKSALDSPAEEMSWAPVFSKTFFALFVQSELSQ